MTLYPQSLFFQYFTQKIAESAKFLLWYCILDFDEGQVWFLWHPLNIKNNCIAEISLIGLFTKFDLWKVLYFSSFWGESWHSEQSEDVTRIKFVLHENRECNIVGEICGLYNLLCDILQTRLCRKVVVSPENFALNTIKPATFTLRSCYLLLGSACRQRRRGCCSCLFAGSTTHLPCIRCGAPRASHSVHPAGWAPLAHWRLLASLALLELCWHCAAAVLLKCSDERDSLSVQIYSCSAAETVWR